MSEHGYAYISHRPRRIEELMCPHPFKAEREFEVVKTIALAGIDCENFITDLASDRAFLEDNAALCGKDGPVIHCLLIKRRNDKEGILAVPGGAWVDIAEFLPQS